MILFQPNYTAVAETCNTFRVYGDIMDSFQSIGSITSWYVDDPGQFLDVVRPGSFTDADMVRQLPITQADQFCRCVGYTQDLHILKTDFSAFLKRF